MKDKIRYPSIMESIAETTGLASAINRQVVGQKALEIAESTILSCLESKPISACHDDELPRIRRAISRARDGKLARLRDKVTWNARSGEGVRWTAFETMIDVRRNHVRTTGPKAMLCKLRATSPSEYPVYLARATLSVRMAIGSRFAGWRAEGPSNMVTTKDGSMR